MIDFDLNTPSHVHFVGIGGSSMSGLAQILMEKGFTVTGSDNNEGKETDTLKARGCPVYIPQSEGNVTDDIDLAVYTAAIHEDNPELMEIRRRGIPAVSRADFLGAISSNFKNSVCVSGTHGKTTTTSLITDICIAAGLDPTISVGGVVETIGGNMRVGSSDTFITEACEYTNSFLSLHPTIAVILNIEADHLDFFGDLEHIRYAFRDFAGLLPPDGTLVINSDIDDYGFFKPDNGARLVTYGTDPSKSDYYAENITFDGGGLGSYDLYKNGTFAYKVSLGVPGMHNVSNSLAAIAAAEAAGAGVEAVIAGLKASSGAGRRLEYKGTFNGARVIDDYAHHPDEIRATLSAVRLMTPGKVWAVFQPHSFSRTHDFLKDFADTLSELADVSVLMEIFNNREVNTYGVSSSQIRDILTEKGKEAYYFKTFEEIASFLQEHCGEGDTVVTMSAGNIYKLAQMLVG